MKATLANSVVANDDNADIIEFAQGIDFAPLFDHIRKTLTAYIEFETPVLAAAYNGDLHVKIESKSVLSQTGIFSHILKDCVVRNFGGGFFKSKAMGELDYSVTIVLSYEYEDGGRNSYKDGGRNSMDVTEARYYESTGWEFF